MQINGMTSMSPDSYIFPIIVKCSIHELKMSGFSLISVNLLMFDYLVFLFLFFVQKLYILAPS